MDVLPYAFALPASQVVVDDLPRWKVMRQQSPGDAGALTKERIMKANRLLSLITAAVLVSASVTFPQAQGAALQASGSPQVVRACADVERSIPENSSKGASVCAVALETSLNADDAALALLMSAKGPNAVNVKRLLVKQGLTMQPLEGAQIRFAKIEMDSPSRIKITIKCCPLTIIISF